MTAKKKNPQKVGRPKKLTQKLTDDICEWIGSGRSLRSFCRQSDAIDISSITRWIVTEPEFYAQYAQARESAGYAHADGIIEVVELLVDQGIDPQTAKVVIDGLKWAAERMAPKSHSQKLVSEHTGPNGTPLNTQTVVILPAKDESTPSA